MENQRLIDAILGLERPMARAHAEWYVKVLPGDLVARVLTDARSGEWATAFLHHEFFLALTGASGVAR